MKEILNYIQNLVSIYNYKPLPELESKKARDLYSENIPNLLSWKPLLDSNGNKISSGFDRIVIGDYGAYIEISKDKMNLDLLTIPSNQKFRLSPGFYGKYIWLTSDGSNKIYQQIRTVKYADYKVGYYYISPYEVNQFSVPIE